MAVVEGFLVPVAGGVSRCRDGKHWSFSPVAGVWYDSCYIPTLARWVLVGLGVATSDDGGDSWAIQPGVVPGGAALFRVVWADSLGLVVAVGQAGLVMTSPDGESWTQRSAGFGSSAVMGLAWSQDLGLLVAAGTGGQVRTSTDALVWTGRSVGVAFESPTTLAWLGPLSKFVLVASDSNGDPVRRESASGTSGWSGFSVAGGEPSQTIVHPFFVEPSPPGGAVAYGEGRVVLITPAGYAAHAVRGGPPGEGVAYSDVLKVYCSVPFWSPNLNDWFATEGAGGAVVGRVAVGRILIKAPLLPSTLGPSGTVNKDATVRFRWGFSSPETGDTQSSFEVRYRTQNEGWAVVRVESPNLFWDAPAGTFAAGSFEWQVRTAGVLGDWSGWSASEFFVAVPAPVGPMFTTPVDGGVIGSGTATVGWSVPDQEAYQLRRIGDDGGFPDLGNVLWDSGQVVASVREAVVGFPVNNRFEHLQLRVRAGGLWSGWVSIRVEVSFTPPPVPTVVTQIFTVQGLVAGLRYSVNVPEPGPGEPKPTVVEVWRRVEGDSGDGIRVAKGLSPGRSHDDYAVASGVEYEVRARVFGENETFVWSEWDERVIGVLAVSEGGVLGLEGR